MKLSTLLGDYLKGLVCYVIVGYFVTANPDGTLNWHWNVLNLWLTSSYLIFYPLLLNRVPQLRRPWLAMKSLTNSGFKASLDDRSSYHQATNPVMNRYDMADRMQRQDDGANLAITLLVRGVYMLIAIPGLIIYGIWTGIKKAS